MTPELRNTLSIARQDHYYGIMRTCFYSFAAVAAIDQFGPGGYSAPLASLVVAVTAYGVLAGGAALSDIQTMQKDMDPEFAQTYIGRAIANRNVGALKMASTGLLLLVGIAELFSILT